MKLSDKLILTDADGVLVDWVYSFNSWMTRHGYSMKRNGTYELSVCYGLEKAETKRLVRMFNESANISYLPPLRDAIKYVRKLHEEHGYIFHCITSLSLDPFAAKAREHNLKALFGETVFEEIICLDTGADKDDALLPYEDTGCFWIEDKEENAMVGSEMGLNSILIEHEHNKDFTHENIVKLKNWKEIYHMIA